MAFVNDVKFTAGSSGTADFSDGTAIIGFRNLAGGPTSGQTYSYRAFSADLSQWENGQGVYTSGSPGTLTRATVYESSTGSKINFTTAPVVILTPLKADYDALRPLAARVYSEASNTAPTPNVDSYDQHNVTALAAGATFGAPSGTPAAGQRLIVRIVDNGSTQTLAWNAIYRAIGSALPSATVAGKTMYVGFLYNSVDSKWDCMAVAQQP